MTFDWLKDPVSDDAPCGANLESTDDEPFLDYYYEAESRMPERFFMPAVEAGGKVVKAAQLFDRQSVDHKSELAEITKLLKRTRDLRLLSLLARFMILAGRLPQYAEALVAIADVLEVFPNDAHPTDVSERRGTLEELGSNVSVVLPLQYAEIAGPGEVSLRRQLVALGSATARAGEDGLNTGKLIGEISAPGNSKPVEQVHAALNIALSALSRIRSACLRNEVNPFNPGIEPAEAAITEMLGMIQSGRPDLVPWAAEDAVDDEESDDSSDEDSDDHDTDTPTPSGGKASTAAAIVVTKIPNRAAALATIKAIESYFATHEPSSPALLLVTQSRLLFGRPLVEALETLLPEQSERAKIDFGAETGFVLDMTRLKLLASEAASVAQSADDEDAGPDPEVTNRSDVAGHLSALDEFYRAREPASPIPVLLFRARTYLEKDFSSIVTEIIPPQADK
ncbi:type VI secretion system ImpA family N-terminal domain-containing protein [Yoonia sp.]|uniref:type VI secretion system protein TssA n=1 Tax=Yoonia sp. TaxID=2212373 RepID=UPI00239EC54A|nr:type VI secretion system ImpA family N-terminal domain-containing protein [Yoonia sp.]MDE0849850.1 type VI secretion system ImpA family N-terminal domain-containing protein [Yoonia sp.]